MAAIDHSESGIVARVRASAQQHRPALDETTVRLLPQHASLRRYARVGGAAAEVAMALPPAGGVGDEKGSVESVTLAEDTFVLAQRWLSKAGVRVPEVFAIDEERRVLWVEDLGEALFDDVARREGVEATYTRGVDFLVEMQTRMQAAPPGFVTSRRFDAGMLRWELDHYVEWRLEEQLGVALPEGHRTTLSRCFDALVEDLARIPQRVMHRDFQSHNLMVVDGELVVIDFQDAMMGPAVYDGVAFLRDSYLVLEPAVFERLLSRYCSGLCDVVLDTSAPDEVREMFLLQTVQRKLKDAGRFVYIDRVKGNPSFMGYIDDSLSYVSRALRTLGTHRELGRLLAQLDAGIVYE